ncbi:N-acetylmannosamine kinase [Labrys miyagiensis]
MAQHRVSRLISRRVVFESLLHKGPISRADLSKETGLSKQTISEIVDSFDQQGWVRQTGRTSGNVGRTALLYEIARDTGFVVGVDLGGTKVSAAIADIAGEILSEITEPTDPRGGQAVLEQVVALASQLTRNVRTSLKQVRSVVIGTPGVAIPETGSIDLAPNIADLAEIDAFGFFSRKFKGLLRIENDVNLALLGEIWQGCARDVSNVAFIALGTGIGLGIFSNGQLVRGATGAAGEIGFLPLGRDPFSADARIHGSLELEVGAVGIVARYHAAGGRAAADVRQIFEHFEQGDEIARRVIGETSRMIALAIASVCVVLDPKLLVLGGSIGGRPEILQLVQEDLKGCAPRPIEVRASALRNRAGVVGALAAALSQLHEALFGVPDLPGDLALPLPKGIAA